MARPAKYTDEDKPVSVTIRIPRDLYDAAQSRARLRRSNLTEVLIEGLRLSLETPTDPRDILALQDNAALQDLETLIDARIVAQLAQHAFHQAQMAFSPPTLAPAPVEAPSAPSS